LNRLVFTLVCILSVKPQLSPTGAGFAPIRPSDQGAFFFFREAPDCFPARLVIQ